MSTGATMLIAFTGVVILDVLVALHFRRLAGRIERGEQVLAGGDPATLRQMANLLVWGVPPIWIVIALIAFGVIPAGIDTIKF